VKVYGFVPGFISNRAAFNIKEKVDCRIEDVKVYDCEIAFRLRGDTGRGSANVTIINCIAYNNNKVFRTEDDIEKLHIYNGTFDKQSSGVYFQNAAGGYEQSTFELKNSLFMGSKPADASDNSNLSADNSFFIDAANNDYHLVAGSPAIDTGLDIAEVIHDYDGNPRPAGAFDIGAFEYVSTTDIPDPISISHGFDLMQNYPNPFNPVTNIQFSLSKAAEISLRVYNIIGQEVNVIVDRQFLRPGIHKIEFDGKWLPTGIYFYRLDGDAFSETRQMTLIK
jgi:hypothetical protein